MWNGLALFLIVNLLKPDLGLDLIDPRSSSLIFIDVYSFSAKFQMIDTSMNNFEAKTGKN